MFIFHISGTNLSTNLEHQYHLKPLYRDRFPLIPYDVSRSGCCCFCEKCFEENPRQTLSLQPVVFVKERWTYTQVSIRMWVTRPNSARSESIPRVSRKTFWTHTHTDTHTHTHTHTHARTHTFIHTNTHIYPPTSLHIPTSTYKYYIVCKLIYSIDLAVTEKVRIMYHKQYNACPCT